MIKWYHTPLEKETLSKLTERDNYHGFIQVIIQLFFTIFLGVVVYHAFYNLPLFIAIPLFYLYATVYSFLSLSGARLELSHKTVFKSKLCRGAIFK